VIDDEETIRAVAKVMMEKMGFNVITAEDGRAGVKLFEQLSKDITFVLLDMTMPHMNGEETFRELRKIKKNVRVILSSGYSQQSALAQFTGKGLAGFIQKPYQYKELMALVKTTLTDTPA